MHEIIREFGPIGRHGIHAGYCAQCDSIVKCPFITHHSDSAVSQKYCACLPYSVIEFPFPKTVYEYGIGLLKDSYLFKFNEGNVMGNPSRKSLMADLCFHFPNFNMLRLLKDGFMRVYACEGREEAEEAYQEWEKILCKADPKIFSEFYRFGRTVRNWHNEIFQYFEPGFKYTNAASEGLNSLLQAINSQGRGYSFDVLRLKALYRKEAALPSRTITKRTTVFHKGGKTKPILPGGMTETFLPRGDWEEVIEKTLTITPRGADLEKLLSAIEESGL